MTNQCTSFQEETSYFWYKFPINRLSWEFNNINNPQFKVRCLCINHTHFKLKKKQTNKKTKCFFINCTLKPVKFFLFTRAINITLRTAISMNNKSEPPPYIVECYVFILN